MQPGQIALQSASRKIDKMSITRAQEILKSQFGYDSFRLNQQAAIEAVLAKKDAVVLMPTGGGNRFVIRFRR